MEFLSSLKDKVEGAVDRAQGALAERVATKAEPKVHKVIDGRVDAFRDSTLAELPRQCEERLKDRSDDSSVAWVFNKVLGDNTDVLVEKLLERFRPGVVSATDGLSLSATQTIIAALRDWLDGEEEEEEGGRAAAVEGAQEGVEQLRVSDEQRGEEASGAGGSSSFRAAFQGLAKGALLEGKISSFEEAARALAHPLFDKLKREVWELVPAGLQDALDDLVGEREGDVEDDADAAGVAGDGDGDGGPGGHGWSGWVKTKLAGRAGRLLDRVMAAAVDAIDEPLQRAINKLVDELEETATSQAFQQIRETLGFRGSKGGAAEDAAAA